MMWGRAISTALLLRLVPAVAVGATVVFAGAPAGAQSAADKATARQLAVQGIKLYDDGKYSEALDKLQRAQTLYDAPVHLLYIARCQHKLGMLVESAESYRRLVRVPLGADAPQVFRDAVQDGRKELGEVEPKVPTLRIHVQPSGVQGLVLTIDGSQVSAAVVGVDRPINPGQHKVEVSAPGYQLSASTIAVAKGEKKAVSLTLQPAPTGTPVAPTAPPPGRAQPGAQPPPVQPAYQPPVEQPPAAQPQAPAAEPEEPGGVGFLFGLRLGGILPLGNLDSNLAGEEGAFPAGHSLDSDEVGMSDVVQGGGGAELHLGVRFAKYFTPVVFGGIHGLQAQDTLDQLAFEDVEYDKYQPPEARAQLAQTAQSTPMLLSLGIGLIIGTARGKLGGFGEVDFVYHLLQATQEVTYAPQAPPDPTPGPCTIDRTYTGGAVRLGGGAAIPIGGVFQLSPFATAAVGQFSHAEVKGDCQDASGGKVDYAYDPQAQVHVILTLGVGGDFLFGADKPAE